MSAYAVTTTLAARIVSALLSFAVFAQVARVLPPPVAARVLFFSFVFGFGLATFRTFHLITAGIRGSETRSAKLRRIRNAAGTLAMMSLVLAPIAWGLLIAQSIAWPVAMAGVVLTVLCGHDVDLARSVLGRQPLLPVLTAAGSVVGSLSLVSAEQPTADLCAVAFLLQWAPVAAYNLTFGWRLLRSKGTVRTTAASRARRIGATLSTLLLSLFDGAVLNAPFIVATPLPAVSALNLALGNRLFVASLALFPLISSWVVSGDMDRIASRFHVRPALMFVSMQVGVSLVAGCAYVGVYQGIVGAHVGPVAVAIFVATLLAYVVHSAGIRFVSHRIVTPARTLCYASVLTLYYAFMLWENALGSADYRVIVASVFVTLVAPPLLIRWALRSRTLRRSDGDLW